METSIRTCQACNSPIRGRSDKRFCDDYCRNKHNNQENLKKPYRALVRNINNILLKNRRILESFFQDNVQNLKTSREKLLSLGFNFKFITHTYTNKSGKTYFYCYDYGYLVLSENQYLLVKQKSHHSN